MSVAIQFRRGTTTNHSGFAGLLGEITMDTTKKTLVVHDGSTLGGNPLSKEGHTHTSSNVSGLMYQVVQISGTAQTAQPNLNFSNLFTASNDTPNSRTTVTLANNNTTGAGTYGSSTKVPQIVLSATGLITSVTEVTVSGGAPGGAAGGDLKNTYPNPGVASVGGAAAADIATATTLVSAATNVNTVSTIVKRDVTGNFSANVITAALIGDVTGNCSGTAGSFTGNLTGDVVSTGMATTLTTVNTNVGSFGNSTTVPQITVDGKGRITAVSNVAISGNFLTNGTSAGGDLGGTLPSPTVSQVGGVAAVTVAAGVNLANAAVNLSTPNALVQRDGSGSANFANVFIKTNVATSSITPSFDLTKGGIQQVVIPASGSPATISVSLTGIAAGQFVLFDFVGNGQTNTITWPSTVKGGGTSTGNTNALHNYQMFWSDGTNLYYIDAMRTDIG